MWWFNLWNNYFYSCHLVENVPNFLFPYARPELALCVDVHLKVFLLKYLVSAVYRASLYTRLEAKKMKFRGDESKTQSDPDSSEDCRSKQVTKNENMGVANENGNCWKKVSGSGIWLRFSARGYIHIYTVAYTWDPAFKLILSFTNYA